MAGLISPDRDIEGMCQNFGTGPNLPEQLMLDTFVSSLLRCRNNKLHPSLGRGSK